jgi:hypothetical protein
VPDQNRLQPIHPPAVADCADTGFRAA